MSVIERNFRLGRGEHPINVCLTDAAMDILQQIPRGGRPFSLEDHREFLTTITLVKIAGRDKLDGFVVIEAADVERLLVHRQTFS